MGICRNSDLSVEEIVSWKCFVFVLDTIHCSWCISVIMHTGVVTVYLIITLKNILETQTSVMRLQFFFWFLKTFFLRCNCNAAAVQQAGSTKVPSFPSQMSMCSSQCGPGLSRAVWAAEESPWGSAAPDDWGERLLEPGHFLPRLQGVWAKMQFFLSIGLTLC